MTRRRAGRGLRAAILARWLGPWADQQRAPAGVTRTVIEPQGGAPGARIFTGPRPVGAVLLVPGLHYAGPDDPRLDRLARVLAAAGAWVYAPCLPDFLALRLSPRVIDDTIRAHDAALTYPDCPAERLGVMSISFGSLPALTLAAARPQTVSRLLVFGGYADWVAVMRFVLSGRHRVAYDPLNRPVVYLNLLDRLPGAPADPTPLAEAWRGYVEATWGRPAVREDGAWQAIARAHADRLPAELRPLFLEGCGVGPGDTGRVDQALQGAEAARTYLDPRPALPRIGCPVTLVHGREDDVIPHTELARLAAAFPPQAPVRGLVTGAYGHTGGAEGAGWRLALSEARTTWGVLGALAALAD